ncbi:E3 ubiquitin-protein ligase siah-1 [Aphelenchoides bicaudatus]|nr:E3 ubiquitin-protein ligase siah-1 [Aphelenchoides bicaudatus]
MKNEIIRPICLRAARDRHTIFRPCDSAPNHVFNGRNQEEREPMAKTTTQTSSASSTMSTSISAPIAPMTPQRQLQAATLMMNSIPANSVAPQQHGHIGNVLPAASSTPKASSSNLNNVISLESPASSNAELLSAFECPVCMEYMLPPYLQCKSGHLLCGNCRPKVNFCPACRGETPNIRNLAMEKIANTLLFPCKFNTSGCLEFFNHTTKVDHEEHCDFRPYSCPCPGASCKWQGSLEDVMQHLMKNHKSITTLQGEDIVFLATDISLPGAVDWVMMQQLELMNGRRRLSWEATPRSIHEGVGAAITQSDCLSFDTNQAELFAENGNLGINVTIQQL